MGILEDARGLLATDPVCDACLGRVFADRSHGLANAERGRALRTAVALADDVPFEPPDPAECWVCEGVAARYDALADRVLAAIGDTELYTYQVGTRVPPLLEENDRLLRADAGLPEDAGEPLNAEVNREVGRRVGARLAASVDFERPDVQVLIDLAADTVDVQRNSVSIYGRYRKLERDIPQTEWAKYETSVEELVAPPFLSALRGTEAVFHGAGREDVDALMLGTGRPFVLEIKQPRRRTADLATLAAEVADTSDGRVEVEGLRFVSHEMIERVKELEADKTYRAAVVFDEPVESAAFEDTLERLAGATIRQRTPQRVAHRRADRVRERTVYAIDGTLESDREATVEVRGAGGLYIKELISGDDGRTDPSLAGVLGVEATVSTLDVVAVEATDEAFCPPEYGVDHDGEPARPAVDTDG